MWLFLLFLAVPLVEIALFIQVGGAIGLFPTLVIVIATAFLGTYLVRGQGALALGQLQSSFNELRDPSEPLAHGAMILFAGALLLTPGFFTDAVGFALLVPGIRTAIMGYLRTKVHVSGFQAAPGNRSNAPSETIDGTYTEVTESDDGQQGPSGWTRH